MNQMTDMAEFNLSVECDFGKWFHWNTKEVFLSVSADWETEDTVFLICSPNQFSPGTKSYFGIILLEPKIKGSV